MGLDARVYCDCFEKGRFLNPPPFGSAPVLEPDGSLSFDTTDDNLWHEFEEWRSSAACEHPRMWLVSHRLGNIALVALLRAEVSREPERFRMLLSKVLYNGIHAGDFLPVSMLGELRYEVERISSHTVAASNLTQWVRKVWPGFGRGPRRQAPSEQTRLHLEFFQKQMIELIDTARMVEKPICF